MQKKTSGDLMDLAAFYVAAEAHVEWSAATFKTETAFTSLLKLEEELTEVRNKLSDIEAKMRETSQWLDGGLMDLNKLFEELDTEYADMIMCIFSSAKRAGRSVSGIMRAFVVKQKVNAARKWQQNPDGTYSHMKDHEPGFPEGDMKTSDSVFISEEEVSSFIQRQHAEESVWRPFISREVGGALRRGDDQLKEDWQLMKGGWDDQSIGTKARVPGAGNGFYEKHDNGWYWHGIGYMQHPAGTDGFVSLPKNQNNDTETIQP